jgi:inosine/xanthosine triphosphate pyrophosphatase family protein
MFAMFDNCSDLIFAGSDLTFAEMGMAAKKEMNHRVRALEKLIAWLEHGVEG